ncbi:zinc finger domain-containing protein [Nonomuraea sp. KM90]|uniref:zinc finger domain-containing protein n=1 Tax=Nonomuraea sp. KM90 TaxID=3457428 RepID=UPI003FCC3D6F
MEAHDRPMSSCATPAGSPCRTGKAKGATQYRIARFRLVPALAKALNVPTPALRRPGSAWTELSRAAAGTHSSGHATHPGGIWVAQRHQPPSHPQRGIPAWTRGTVLLLRETIGF